MVAQSLVREERVLLVEWLHLVMHVSLKIVLRYLFDVLYHAAIQIFGHICMQPKPPVF